MTIRDGYTERQIATLMGAAWACGGGGGGAVEQHFQTQLDFLLGNTMLMRLSNRLLLELPDLFMIPLKNEGTRGDSWAMVAVMDQGKSTPFPYPPFLLQLIRSSKNLIVSFLFKLYLLTVDVGKMNQHGRLEYGTALCHWDFHSCTIGMMVMYFFWWWHCSGEAFPSFGASEDWY